MNTEDYVSYEQAKKLKEKGFNYEVARAYEVNNNDEEPYWHEVVEDDYNQYNQYIISAPTLSQAQKWLREEKGIDIVIDVNIIFDEKAYSPVVEKKYYYDLYFGNEALMSVDYSTYEEALSDAITKTLELI